ncbi:MOSC domain-containing protein [Thalassococcus sp. BH17M4-6]|uniref:MOSC domain-containing protein n=1 Tax=Thalassococcus sp. BH17M4-6 TaxID=3413148 RepID=UPI003BBEABB2
MKGHLAALLERHHADGRLDWIGLRAARREPVAAVGASVVTPAGLDGDHGRAGQRAVTLLQTEHLPVVAALCGQDAVAPEVLRRNLLISRINLNALRDRDLRIGEAVLRITRPCAPCSRMEEALGSGAYNALRGHGGWCAEVLQPGRIALGDPVVPLLKP